MKPNSIELFPQISPRDDRVLPFCNEAGELADDTKDYEVRRETPKYEQELETEQVRIELILFLIKFQPVYSLLLFDTCVKRM